MFNQIGDATPVKTVDSESHLKRHYAIDALIEDMSESSMSTFKQLEVIKNSLKELSAINEARVLHFKSEIALGNYQIDCNKIAQRMLQEEPA